MCIFLGIHFITIIIVSLKIFWTFNVYWRRTKSDSTSVICSYLKYNYLKYKKWQVSYDWNKCYLLSYCHVCSIFKNFLHGYVQYDKVTSCTYGFPNHFLVKSWNFLQSVFVLFLFITFAFIFSREKSQLLNHFASIIMLLESMSTILNYLSCRTYYFTNYWIKGLNLKLYWSKSNCIIKNRK